MGPQADPARPDGGQDRHRGAGLRHPRRRLRLHRDQQQEDPQLRLGQLSAGLHPGEREQRSVIFEMYSTYTIA